MATPFSPDGSLNYDRAAQLARHLLDNGSTALVVSGTTGESPTLTPDEKIKLFQVVKEVANGAPIIANTGDNETAFSTEFSKRAREEADVDAILMVVPYYNKPSQEGLFQHFKAIAKSVDAPCILYNVPGRTARNLDAQTTLRLSEIENIVGTKEASGDLTQIGHIISNTPDNFLVYSGNDADTLPMLALGACGVISVASHIAGQPLFEMMQAFWNGDTRRAAELHLKLLPVMDALFPAASPSPEPLKAAMKMQDFDCGGLRLPLVECPDAERENLEMAMKNAGLL